MARIPQIGGRALVRAAVALVIFALSILVSACGSPVVLANTLSSDEAVAAAVLDAIYRRDRDALMRLSLKREEFERLVWPALPASRPEVGLPAGDVWQDTFTKSRAHLDRMLREWGGQRLQLIRVSFAGPTTEYDGFSISRKTQLVVRDGTGVEKTVRVFGSIIHQAGGSKVYSYIVD